MYDPKNFWFMLQRGDYGFRLTDDFVNLLEQISSVLNSHRDDAGKYARDALRSRILFRTGGAQYTWVTEVGNASTPRGRFLQDLAKKLQEPGTAHATLIKQTIRELDVSAAILRVHAAVALPDFVDMADPLRILLIGPPGLRLLDGAFVSQALECVSKVPDVSGCDKRVSDVIQAGFFEKAATISSNQLIKFNRVLSSLPDDDRLNTGQPYLDELAVRFDALIRSIDPRISLSRISKRRPNPLSSPSRH